MKKPLALALFLISTGIMVAQNVGIGLNNPTKAKLVVHGVAGAGATVAIFGGESSGISMQRNWPAIGFNQYRDDVTPGAQGKYMSTGYAAIQYFDPTSGNMVFDMFGTGTLNTSTSTAKTALIINAAGNLRIQKDIIMEPNVGISTVAGGVGQNLLPIATALVQVTGIKQYGTNNINSFFVGDHYVIDIGELVAGAYPVITALAGPGTGARVASYIASGATTFDVYIWTLFGQLVQAPFSIVVYKP